MTEEQKQRLAEQREKRAAARNRLKEMKAAAKKESTKTMQEDSTMHTAEDSVFDEVISSVAVLEVSTPKKKKSELILRNLAALLRGIPMEENFGKEPAKLQAFC